MSDEIKEGAFYVHDDGTVECAKCGDKFRLAIFGDGQLSYQCSCGWIFGGFSSQPEWTDDQLGLADTVNRLAEMRQKHGWRVGEELQ